ncbi:MAG: efflux RND transporter periplasmic adaptor subunit [Ketobacteraceae bacterium]|nr:efflux RND transporter periplasmic adaptor subunit [Ketobacteraceae bacterium]
MVATIAWLGLVNPLSAAGVPVEVEPVRRADLIQLVPVTGTVTTPRYASLSTSVEGLIEALHVDIGDQVKQGDVLVSLDDELAQLELQGARAAVREAEEELADAQRRYREAQRLIQQNNISQSVYDEREAAVRISQAALERRQAEAAHQQATVARYQVKAPFAGVISEREVAEGEWATPGAPLLVLVDSQQLFIDFAVSQEYFPQLTQETPVQVQLPGRSEQRFQGQITSIVPVSDRSARTFIVRARLNEPAAVTPGMSAKGSLAVNSGEEGIVVSRDAITRHPNGRISVWLVEKSEDGQWLARETPVKLGQQFGQQVEVRSGLKGGEKVVVRGNNTLQDGQQVAIQSSSKAPVEPPAQASAQTD